MSNVMMLYVPDCQGRPDDITIDSPANIAEQDGWTTPPGKVVRRYTGWKLYTPAVDIPVPGRLNLASLQKHRPLLSGLCRGKS